MNEAEHATEPEHVTELVTIRAPWPARLGYSLAALLTGLALFLFSLNQYSNANEARQSAEVARHQAEQIQAKADQLQAQADKLTAQVADLQSAGECRSQRSGDTVGAIGAVVGNMSDLVGLLAARDSSTAIGALLADRANLSADYKAKAAALATAVDDCKGQ